VKEVWKDVVGFEDYFMVSNTGSVFGKRSGKVLKKQILPSGYEAVSTRIGGRTGQTYCLRVHRLVAEAFLSPPSDTLIKECAKDAYGVVLVRHLDGNRVNNNSSNLAWGTYQDNADDFHSSNFRVEWLEKVSASSRMRAKLSNSDIEVIKARYIKGCKVNGCRALAAQFNVDHSQISRALRK
jgi:hypothetical protein